MDISKPIGFELLNVGKNCYRFELKSGDFLAVDEILSINEKDNIIKYSKTSYMYLGKESKDIDFAKYEVKISEIKEITKLEAKHIK